MAQACRISSFLLCLLGGMLSAFAQPGVDHADIGDLKAAAEKGDPDRYIEEVLDVVRRTLGKPVRTPRV